MAERHNLNQAYWEVAHSLYALTDSYEWKAPKLLEAARKAEIHSSGWPIGVVLNRGDAHPVTKKQGIVARIKSSYDDMHDYWELHRNGNFYFMRTLEEAIFAYDGKRTKQHVIHLDTRIKRTAEALVHCQKLYETLKVNPKQAIHFKIRHFGLKKRKVSAAYDCPLRWRPHYECHEDNHEFFKICSLDLIAADLKGIVYEATKSLFEYFNWFDYPKNLSDKIVEDFLVGK